MSNIPQLDVHLIRSVAKITLKEKGLPEENLQEMIDFVRRVLVAERKYYKKSEARAARVSATPAPDAA